MVTYRTSLCTDNKVWSHTEHLCVQIIRYGHIQNISMCNKYGHIQNISDVQIIRYGHIQNISVYSMVWSHTEHLYVQIIRYSHTEGRYGNVTYRTSLCTDNKVCTDLYVQIIRYGHIQNISMYR